MHINENAYIARKVRNAENGKVLTVHHGRNSRTGEDIVWLAIEGQRTRRLTGKNIAALYAEIDAAIAAGEGIDLLAAN